MFKRLLSISFILLFMVTISLPSMVLFMEDSIDVTLLLDISEEEEENEKNKELELFQLSVENLKKNEITSIFKIDIHYQFKTYATPHLNLVFPPPDFI